MTIRIFRERFSPRPRFFRHGHSPLCFHPPRDLRFGRAVARRDPAPTLDEPVPVNGEAFPIKVAPVVPVGKALVFPLTVSNSNGRPIRYKVSSSNPNVLVRVRTGLPRLRMTISHAVGAGTANDPEFQGDLEFALLRDFTPITANIISGFAQAGYYNGKIFHRIADLNPSEEPDGSFIIQGGDPTGTGSGGPGFQFENEFKAPLIFVGRGQLAMANAGSNTTTFRGTNGSQFFITAGQPRFLDFNHTIFGQLLRGWDLLEKLTKVPRGANDKPTQNVNLVSAEVTPNFSDAILFLSAVAPGTATITVKIDDGVNPREVTEFNVSAVKDDFNDPPFLDPIPPRVAPKDTVFEIPLKPVDLESDFLFFSNRVIAGSGQSSQSGNPARAMGTGGYQGILTLGVGVSEYDQTYRGTIDGATGETEDMKPAVTGVGDRQLDAEAVSFTAVAGQGFAEQIVARYTDADPRGVPGAVTAQINWGDGSASGVATGTISRDATRPGIANYVVSGSHTYAHPGIYPLTVTLNGNRGALETVRGQAVVPAGTIGALGSTLKVQRKLKNGVVATFVDSAPGRSRDYAATISWGDGTYGEGVIRRSRRGGFLVMGTHRWTDAGAFAVSVRIRKNNDPATDAVAWSRAQVSGVSGVDALPPFSFAHLIGQFAGLDNNTPLRTTTGSGADLQAFINAQLIVLNAGTKTSPAGKLRFYLSADKTLNLTDKTIPDPANPSQTIINPADRVITIAGVAEGNLQSLAPGQGVRYVFDQSGDTDQRLRLPKGEIGSSLNILSVFDYNDPLARALPISRTVVFGPLNGFVVNPKALVIREAGGDSASAAFTVRMDRQPSANVTVSVTLSDATQATISATSLTFTPENFNAKQTVTVTAKEDGAVDGTKTVRVTLGAAVSADRQWSGIDPDDVTVSVLDKLPAQ